VFFSSRTTTQQENQKVSAEREASVRRRKLPPKFRQKKFQNKEACDRVLRQQRGQEGLRRSSGKRRSSPDTGSMKLPGPGCSKPD